MSNRDIVERALVCFADPQRRERYFDVYSENVILHGYSGVEPGLDSVRRYYAGVWSVFPDARVIAEDLIETDDKVILRFAMVGELSAGVRKMAKMVERAGDEVGTGRIERLSRGRI